MSKINSQSKTLKISDIDDQLSQEIQIQINAKTSVQDLIRNLKEIVDQNFDYKIYFSCEQFNGNGNTYIYQMGLNFETQFKYKKVKKQESKIPLKSLQSTQGSNKVQDSEKKEQDFLQFSQNDNFQSSKSSISENKQIINQMDCKNCQELIKFIEQHERQLKEQNCQIQELQKKITQFEWVIQQQNQKEIENQSRQNTLYYQMKNLESEIQQLKNENQRLNQNNLQERQVFSDQSYKQRQNNDQSSNYAEVKRANVQLQIDKTQCSNQTFVKSPPDSPSRIELDCKHAQEKNYIEEIVQQAIQQQQIPLCPKCKQTISSNVLRKLGHLGEQYLMIKVENNLNQLFNQLFQNKKKLGKCSTNQCQFFCIWKDNLQQNSTYCPQCLSFSVKQCYNQWAK